MVGNTQPATLLVLFFFRINLFGCLIFGRRRPWTSTCGWTVNPWTQSPPIPSRWWSIPSRLIPPVALGPRWVRLGVPSGQGMPSHLESFKIFRCALWGIVSENCWFWNSWGVIPPSSMLGPSLIGGFQPAKTTWIVSPTTGASTSRHFRNLLLGWHNSFDLQKSIKGTIDFRFLKVSSHPFSIHHLRFYPNFPIIFSSSPVRWQLHLRSQPQVNYLYAFTTFFPEIRRSTDNSVTFQALRIPGETSVETKGLDEALSGTSK